MPGRHQHLLAIATFQQDIPMFKLRKHVTAASSVGQSPVTLPSSELRHRSVAARRPVILRLRGSPLSRRPLSGVPEVRERCSRRVPASYLKQDQDGHIRWLTGTRREHQRRAGRSQWEAAPPGVSSWRRPTRPRPSASAGGFHQPRAPRWPVSTGLDRRWGRREPKSQSKPELRAFRHPRRTGGRDHLGGVTGDLVDGDPNHQAHRPGRVLIGILAVVLVRKRVVDLSIDVVRHGHPAPQFHVILRVG
jgi:hypothetical protein